MAKKVTLDNEIPVSEYKFSEIFELDEIQKLQDLFSAATGLGSAITEPDGTPITKPSGFCDLCKIIRNTEVGAMNCRLSDSAIGSPKEDRPRYQKCLSGGLLDGGASIFVEGKYIANWLVGQVLDEDCNIDDLLPYADKIGVDRDFYKEALKQVKRMSKQQYKNICDFLFLNAKHLSNYAIKNKTLNQQITIKDVKEKELTQLNNALELDVQARMIQIDQTNNQLEEANAELEEINAMLEEEISERQRIEEDLRKLNKELENIVAERTYQLQEMNASLEEEISERKRTEDILSEENKFMQAIFESVPGYLYVYDQEGNLVRWNKKHEEMTGYSTEELTKMNLRDWFNEADTVRVFEAVDEAFTTGMAEIEADLIMKGGDKIRIRTNGVPLFMNGKAYITGVGIDITKQKMDEEELKESEARHRAMITNISDVIAIIDENGVIQYKSPNIKKWFGWEADELIGSHFLEMAHSRDKKYISNSFTRLLKEDNKVETLEYRYKCKDGSYKTIELTAINLLNNSAIKGVLVNYHDITERKFIEQELKKSEIKYRLSEENLNKAQKIAHLGSWIWDMNSNEAILSENMYLIFGLDREKVEGSIIKAVAKAIHPDDLRIVHPLDPKFYLESKAIEFRVIWPDQSIHYIWSKVGDTVIDKSGKVSLLTGISQDVTERKLIEDAKAHAEAANDAKSIFLANMSHEIRTPINAIIGFNYLIQKTNLTETQRDYVEKTIISAQNLLGHVNAILDFSKIEANKIILEYNRFDLYETLHSISNIISFNLYEKKLNLHYNIDPEIPQYLNGDAFRLNQVLLNLINNSVKFTDKGDITITLGVEARKKHSIMIKFTVEDMGIGMSKEQQRKLFGAFSQGDMSTTRKYGGTGLGLSISKSLIELMGGTIKVKSEIGQGSQFIFTAKFKLNTDSIEEGFYSTKFNNLKVLIITENEDMAKIVQSQLLQYGITYIKVDTVKGALHRKDIDGGLILLDWAIYKEKGKKLITNIRKNINTSDLRVMLISSFREPVLEMLEYDEQLNGIFYFPMGGVQFYNKLSNVFPENIEIDHSIKTSVKEEATNVLLNKKLLLVEDNEINQELAKAILEEYGAIISIADNGRKALEMVIKEHFDLILMDLQMPIMDGYEAAKKIRAMEELKNVPIIAMSAHAIKGIKEKVYEAGMNDYITKPFEVSKMIGTLQKWTF